jgi:hypothetical protein
MLKRLLTLVAANDGASSLAGLAREMGIPRAMAEQIMSDLVRGGYLRPGLVACAPMGCAACPARVGCHPPTGFRLWELTNKGRCLLT